MKITGATKSANHLIHVAVVDDHHLFRHGLVSLLQKYNNVKVVLEAANGKDLSDKLATLNERSKAGINNLPDIILLDLQMPEMDGIETTMFLQKYFPQIRIIILTMHNEDEFIFDLMNKGASGFLAKDKTVETVMESILSIMENGFYVNESILKAIVRGAQRQRRPVALPVSTKLSEREVEIIRLICEQKTNQQIADMLNVSQKTIENHRTTIFAKTEVKNIAGLVLYAIRCNLIRLEQ